MQRQLADSWRLLSICWFLSLRLGASVSLLPNVELEYQRQIAELRAQLDASKLLGGAEEKPVPLKVNALELNKAFTQQEAASVVEVPNLGLKATSTDSATVKEDTPISELPTLVLDDIPATQAEHEAEGKGEMEPPLQETAQPAPVEHGEAETKGEQVVVPSAQPDPAEPTPVQDPVAPAPQVSAPCAPARLGEEPVPVPPPAPPGAVVPPPQVASATVLQAPSPQEQQPPQAVAAPVAVGIAPQAAGLLPNIQAFLEAHSQASGQELPPEFLLNLQQCLKPQEKQESKAMENDGALSMQPNSSTHRASYARLTRLMDGKSSGEFPHMSKMWGDKAERAKLFKLWVEKGEDRGEVEGEVLQQRTMATQYKGVREFLSIRDMFKLGWPVTKINGIVAAGGGVVDEHAPQDPSLVSFWVTTKRKRTELDESKTQATARCSASVDAASMGSLFNASMPMHSGLAPGAMLQGEAMDEDALTKLQRSLGGVCLMCLESFRAGQQSTSTARAKQTAKAKAKAKNNARPAVTEEVPSLQKQKDDCSAVAWCGSFGCLLRQGIAEGLQ